MLWRLKNNMEPYALYNELEKRLRGTEHYDTFRETFSRLGSDPANKVHLQHLAGFIGALPGLAAGYATATEANAEQKKAILALRDHLVKEKKKFADLF